MRRLLPLLLVCAFAPVLLADVSVTLTMPASVVLNGDRATAVGQLTVTNGGPSAAQNVVVDFDGKSYADLPGFTCAQASDHYRCTAASMAPGSASAAIVATWLNAPNGTIETTTVTVGNNSASAQTTVVWQADVELEDVAVPSPATPGAVLFADAYYSNRGPSPATDVKITISIPPGATYQGYFADDWFKCIEPAKGSTGDLVCTASSFGNLQGGFSIEAAIRIDPSAAPGTTIAFPATLTGSDAVNPSQSKSGSVTVVQTADMAVAMTAPSSAKIGSTYDTVVTVTNNGPGPALNARVVMNFPFPIAPQTAVAPAGWNCSGSTCAISSFPPGTATFTFPAFIPAGMSLGTTTQTAQVFAQNDTNGSNNSNSATVTIQPAPQTDIGVSISGAPSVVRTGDIETYTVQVTNSGNYRALNVDLTAQLPGTRVSNSCGRDTLACSFAILEPGASGTATFVMRTDSTVPGTLTGSVVATALNASQKTASTTTTSAGEPNADLEATLIAPASVGLLKAVVWTIGIVNHGPDPVYGWSLSFSVPGVTNLGVANPIDGIASCSAFGTTVQCSGTRLTNNQFSVEVSGSGVAANIHATLTASTDNNDPLPANNVVTADTAITLPGPDLTVTLKPAAWAIAPGATDDVTIEVANVGREASTGSTVTLSLAPDFVLVTAPPWCSGTTTLKCNYGYLSSGVKAPTTITLRPSSPGLGTFTATATVTTTAAEERTDNNSGSVSISVVEPGERHRATRH